MRYRLLGSSAIRVSEVALGTMTFGERWGWGAPLEESRRMLDLFLDQGGNFVDTACNYTDGESERLLVTEALNPGAAVLIGGLGVGFSLRAALDGGAASVVVVEREPAVIAWKTGTSSAVCPPWGLAA